MKNISTFKVLSLILVFLVVLSFNSLIIRGFAPELNLSEASGSSPNKDVPISIKFNNSSQLPSKCIVEDGIYYDFSESGQVTIKDLPY